jgi:hypothetical protein
MVSTSVPAWRTTGTMVRTESTRAMRAMTALARPTPTTVTSSTPPRRASEAPSVGQPKTLCAVIRKMVSPRATVPREAAATAAQPARAPAPPPATPPAYGQAGTRRSSGSRSRIPSAATLGARRGTDVDPEIVGGDDRGVAAMLRREVAVRDRRDTGHEAARGVDVHLLRLVRLVEQRMAAAPHAMHAQQAVRGDLADGVAGAVESAGDHAARRAAPATEHEIADGIALPAGQRGRERGQRALLVSRGGGELLPARKRALRGRLRAQRRERDGEERRAEREARGRDEMRADVAHGRRHLRRRKGWGARPRVARSRGASRHAPAPTATAPSRRRTAPAPHRTPPAASP